MEVILHRDPAEACRTAALIIARLVRERPRAVLGLATGATPIPLYAELVRMHREEGLDFGGVTTFNLDEYLGLGPDHPASYRRFMDEHLFRHINIRPENTHVPDGLAQDVPACCAAYEQAIVDAGGIDLQVLGVGVEGHIGFNEPSSSLASRTRIKTLTPVTRNENAVFFDGDVERVPHHCITMGIGTIMEARANMLLAFGEKKADVVANLVEGPVTSMCPASILQYHPCAKVIVDAAAASKLRLANYYRWVHDNKPDWQRYAL